MKAGVERIMSDRMNFLSEKGHKITLVTYEQGEHALSFPLHHNILHYDLNTRFFTLMKYGLPRRAFEFILLSHTFKKKLQKVIDTTQPDIISTTTYSLNLIGIILRIKTDAKRIIESHISFDSVLKENDYKGKPLLQIITRYYDQHLLNNVKKMDAFITLTNGDAKQWASYAKKMYVIPNPVTIYPTTVKDHTKTLHRIIGVGRLDPQKGFDLLIESFSYIADQCPEWHIDIFGSGNEEQKLQKLIYEKKLYEQVFIHPASDYIYEEFQNSDFFVFSSRYEGWGLVLVEAMSCGIPAVSFQCDYGPEDILTDHYDGLLVENGNIQDMANKILWMIQNPQERIKMGQAARDSAQRYKKTVILEKWLYILQSLVT